MKDNCSGKIPVIIGVTGHRDIRDEDIDILKTAVADAVRSIQARCPHSQIVVMTSLAEGADQLCAETALEMGLEIVSVLPMPIDEYAKDFEGVPLEKLYELADRSSKTFVSPRTEPFREGRDYLYRQACFYVAGYCHILLALWDGNEGDAGDCGTAATVGITLRNRSYESGEQLHPAAGTVMQIVTPRQSSEEPVPDAGRMILHGDVDICRKILRDTEIYNTDCERLRNGSGKAGPEDAAGSQSCRDTDKKIEAVYTDSDELSMINSVRHRRTLAGLSICATVLAIAFLLYDEIDWQGMIILCGSMIIALFVINAFTERTKFHARYIEYRILAECCRVQTYLRTAGSSREVADIMPWNLQVTIPWVRKAMSAVMIGKEASEKRSILDMWIISQKNYHTNALVRTELQLKRNDRIVKTALVFTLLIYLAALLFEVICCGMFGTRMMFSPQTVLRLNPFFAFICVSPLS